MKNIDNTLLTKSSIMLGLGEEDSEIIDTMNDLRKEKEKFFFSPCSIFVLIFLFLVLKTSFRENILELNNSLENINNIENLK